MPSRGLFTTLRTQGGLLPADFLQRIARGDRALDALTPESDPLAETERINDAANRAWNRLVGAWAAFKAACEKIETGDLGTTTTRERWLLVLFQELSYGRFVASKTIAIAGNSYPISHFWNHTPIHLVRCRLDLDRRTKGAKVAAGTSHVVAALSHGHFNTTLDVRYRRRDGTDNATALARINHFSRSREDGREAPVSLRLIELLAYIQNHYHPRQMVLLSGYRSPMFNADLRNAGGAVAQASPHTKPVSLPMPWRGR